MDKPKPKTFARLKWAGVLLAGWTAFAPGQALGSGHWLKHSNTAFDSVGHLLLLPDGTVMAANNPTDVLGAIGNDWYRLTPDSNGHYINGTWSRIASMNYKRLFYASQVLPDGRVLVAGGEYPSNSPAQSTVEVYNPHPDVNSWTFVNPPTSLLDGTLAAPNFPPSLHQGFVDCESALLPDGRVLLAPELAGATNGTLIYDPRANEWSNGPPTVAWQAEESWVKLPDDSILTVDRDSTNTERYIPSLNRWIRDAPVPVNLWVSLAPVAVGETGPALMLPNGKVFFLGGGHTAIYTPSGTTNLGSWMPGPDIPGGLVSADAPAAMMPEGRILCAVGSPPFADSNGNLNFPRPTSFFEYDYSVGTNGQFTQVDGPTGTTDDVSPYQTAMLVVPDGSVIYCHFEQGNAFYSSFGSQLYSYYPDGAQLTSGRPVITSITTYPDGTGHLTGTGLNGISEGAAYGDNAQMSCNYPIIAFKNDLTAEVSYARTFNWSCTGVQTGSKVVSTDFALPTGLSPMNYSVTVSGAGLSSTPVDFTFVNPSSLSLCPGESGSLSIVATPTYPVQYQWLSNGVAMHGETNAQLNFVSATTNQTGIYQLEVLTQGTPVTSFGVPVSVGEWIRSQPPLTNSATLCQPYTLSVTARGKGTVTGVWYRNGQRIYPDSRVIVSNTPDASGDTLLTLTFTDIKYQDDGTYFVSVQDACGATTTRPFSLRTLPAPPWVQVATNGPASRYQAAMAYDVGRQVTVLFGGQTRNATGAPLLGDTWEFDGTNWTQRFPTNSPAPRSQAQMVYDTWNARMLLVGGQIYTNNQYQLNFETWAWDGVNWQQLVTSNTPAWSQPDPFAACFDAARGETLVYGGNTSTGRVYQLWGFNGTKWSQKNPVGPTPVAPSPLMTFDSVRNVAVLLGGASQSIPSPYSQAAVWEWDGTGWQEKVQSGQIFGGASTIDALTFDTFRGESVLYGSVFGIVDGLSSSAYSVYPYPSGYRFIWRWNGLSWQADPPTPTLGAANGQLYASLCFDEARNSFTCFGGTDDGNSLVTNNTYEIIYQDDPAVLKQPTIQARLIGQKVQLSVLAVGAPVIGYHWAKDGVNLADGGSIAGSATNTLIINPAAVADSGQYVLTMSNLCGMAVSQPIALNVTAGNGTLAVGSTFNAGGAANLVITWSDNTAVLQTSTNLTGPWSAVSGAGSPYNFNPTLPVQFFRLMWP